MTKKPPELVTVIPGPDVGSIPSGLAEHGTRMWREVQREFGITDIGGRLLLAEACAAADMVARLRAQIDADGLMIQMPAGLRTHPAVKDELGYRCFITATLKRLGILDQPVAQHGGPYKKYGI
jgi:hypothetical protein